MYGVAMFRLSHNEWGRRALSTSSVVAHDKEARSPCVRYSALLAQALQHLWLVLYHDVYRWVGYGRGTLLAFSPRTLINCLDSSSQGVDMVGGAVLL